MAAAPKRRAQRLSFTLHPERDADLYAWVQQVPEGELPAHLKVALREYIARYAGQTLEVAVAVRRLQVPALPLPDGGTPAVAVGTTAVPALGGAGGMDRSAPGAQAEGADSDLRASAKANADGNANANAEAEPSAQALDPAEREALQALNARFGEG